MPTPTGDRPPRGLSRHARPTRNQKSDDQKLPPEHDRNKESVLLSQ